MTLVGRRILGEGILARAGGIVLVRSARIAAVLEVHAAVLVPVLVEPVGVVRGEGELLDRGDLQLGRIREIAAQLLVAGLPFPEDEVTAVRHVIADERRTVEPAAVRILEREAREGVTGSVREGILHAAAARIVVGGTVEGRVVRQAGELVQPGVDLRTQVVAVEHVGVHLDDTALTVVSAGQVVLYIFVATGDGDVVLLDRMAVVVQLVVPVRIGIVDPLVAAVADLLHDPGAFGILRHVVHAGQHLGHVVGGVVGVVLAGVGRPELVHGIDGPVAAGLEVGGDRRLFPAHAAAVTDRGLATLFGTGLGRHENDAVRSAGTVDGGGRGILDHGNALHIGGIHAGEVTFGTVDEDQRVGRVDGGDTADVQASGGARVTGRGGDVQARDRTLEHVRQVVRGTVLEFLGIHRRDGAGEVHLLLDAVAHDHGFLQHHVVLLEGDGDPSLTGRDADGLGGVAQAGDFQRHFFGRDAEREGSVGGRHFSGRGSGEDDGGADDGLLSGVQDRAGHDPVLRPDGRDGRQEQREGCSNLSNPSHNEWVMVG